MSSRGGRPWWRRPRPVSGLVRWAAGPGGRADDRDAARAAADAGDTLVEVLLALVVIGLTVVSILGAFATSLSATTEQRTLAKADAVLRSFAETATYEISLSNTPQFVACPASVPDAYSTIASNYTSSSAPNGYTVSITSVTNMSSPCTDSNPSPQQLTAQVTSTGGANDSLSFVVSEPDQTPPAITMAITSISPTSGPAEGGTSVQIYGDGFTGATSVHFGTTAVPSNSFTVHRDTWITATSPPGTGMVDVTVTTPEGTTATSTSDQFTYAPTVTGIKPASGPASGGTSVTITGTGFTGATSVQFGSTAVPAFSPTEPNGFKVQGASSIDVTSPPGTGVVNVTVTTPAGTSATSSADRFTYGGVSVTGISPSSGPSAGGTTVNLLGSGFTGATTVMFGTTPAASFTVNGDTSIAAVSPPGTGAVDITVTTPSGTSATSPADVFTYQPNSVVGLGIVVKSGSGSPSVSCDSSAGSSCRTPDSTTCVMTGSASSTTCDISKCWRGGSNTNVVFYVETVDAAGNPVAYSSSTALALNVTGATTSSSPFTIPATGTSTDPNTVTAILTSKKNVTTVTISGGSYTMIVKFAA